MKSFAGQFANWSKNDVEMFRVAFHPSLVRTVLNVQTHKAAVLRHKEIRRTHSKYSLNRSNFFVSVISNSISLFNSISMSGKHSWRGKPCWVVGSDIRTQTSDHFMVQTFSNSLNRLNRAMRKRAASCCGVVFLSAVCYTEFLFTSYRITAKQPTALSFSLAPIGHSSLTLKTCEAQNW